MIPTKVENLIKIGYLKWKSPTEIANGITILLEIDVQPLDVHNYIQGKHTTWKNLIPYCKYCNENIKTHRRCILCTRMLHNNDFCCLTTLHDL